MLLTIQENGVRRVVSTFMLKTALTNLAPGFGLKPLHPDPIRVIENDRWNI